MEDFPGTMNEHGEWFHPYKREVPEVFQGDMADQHYYPVDKFTQSILTNYATEGVDKDKDDNPVRTHKFYLSKDSAKKAAYEILDTHFEKRGADADAYLAD